MTSQSEGGATCSFTTIRFPLESGGLVLADITLLLVSNDQYLPLSGYLGMMSVLERM